MIAVLGCIVAGDELCLSECATGPQWHKVPLHGDTPISIHPCYEHPDKPFLCVARPTQAPSIAQKTTSVVQMMSQLSKHADGETSDQGAEVTGGSGLMAVQPLPMFKHDKSGDLHQTEHQYEASVNETRTGARLGNKIQDSLNVGLERGEKHYVDWSYFDVEYGGDNKVNDISDPTPVILDDGGDESTVNDGVDEANDPDGLRGHTGAYHAATTDNHITRVNGDELLDGSPGNDENQSLYTQSIVVTELPNGSVMVPSAGVLDETNPSVKPPSDPSTTSVTILPTPDPSSRDHSEMSSTANHVTDRTSLTSTHGAGRKHVILMGILSREQQADGTQVYDVEDYTEKYISVTGEGESPQGHVLSDYLIDNNAKYDITTSPSNILQSTSNSTDSEFINVAGSDNGLDGTVHADGIYTTQSRSTKAPGITGSMFTTINAPHMTNSVTSGVRVLSDSTRTATRLPSNSPIGTNTSPNIFAGKWITSPKLSSDGSATAVGEHMAELIPVAGSSPMSPPTKSPQYAHPEARVDRFPSTEASIVDHAVTQHKISTNENKYPEFDYDATVSGIDLLGIQGMSQDAVTITLPFDWFRLNTPQPRKINQSVVTESTLQTVQLTQSSVNPMIGETNLMEDFTYDITKISDETTTAYNPESILSITPRDLNINDEDRTTIEGLKHKSEATVVGRTVHGDSNIESTSVHRDIVISVTTSGHEKSDSTSSQYPASDGALLLTATTTHKTPYETTIDLQDSGLVDNVITTVLPILPQDNDYEWDFDYAYVSDGDHSKWDLGGKDDKIKNTFQETQFVDVTESVNDVTLVRVDDKRDEGVSEDDNTEYLKDLIPDGFPSAEAMWSYLPKGTY